MAKNEANEYDSEAYKRILQKRLTDLEKELEQLQQALVWKQDEINDGKIPERYGIEKAQQDVENYNKQIDNVTRKIQETKSELAKFNK